MLIGCVGGGVGREGFPLCKVVELVWNPQPMGSSVLSLPWVVWTCDQVGYMAWEEGRTQEVRSKDAGSLQDPPPTPTTSKCQQQVLKAGCFSNILSLSEGEPHTLPACGRLVLSSLLYKA